MIVRSRIRMFLKSILGDSRGLTSAEWLVIGACVLGAAGAAFSTIGTNIGKVGKTVAGQIK